MEIASEIEALLQKNDSPNPNPVAIKKLSSLANQIQPWDSYAGEKAHKIVSLANIYYSDRKHFKYPGGAENLYVEMSFDLLNRIKRQAEIYKSKGD